MNGKRQKIQPGLALQPRDWGEPSVGGSQGVEPSMAKSTLESPAPTDRMSPSTLNPVEPPWYGPVCPVVWEGRHREVPPYRESRGRSCRRGGSGKRSRVATMTGTAASVSLPSHRIRCSRMNWYWSSTIATGTPNSTGSARLPLADPPRMFLEDRQGPSPS